jgi:predicted DNA-binding ribbon-helix-helix protein
MPIKTTKPPVTTPRVCAERGVTTVALADEFWLQLEKVARDNEASIVDLVTLVEDRLGRDNSLSSALRGDISASRH